MAATIESEESDKDIGSGRRDLPERLEGQN
jgi:hypothetical protein